MKTRPKCNYRRCRKDAVVGFRPYRSGYDVTKEVGMQYRCSLHSQGLIRDDRPMPGCFFIVDRFGSTD